MALEVQAPDGSSSSATIKLDGQDITRHCRSIGIHGDAGSLFTAEIGFVVGPALDVVLAADVTVQMQAPEGYDVIAEPQDDGGTRYRLERIPADRYAIEAPERHHVWANGALVCNCGGQRKPGAKGTAPPGWPTVPSEPECWDIRPPMPPDLSEDPGWRKAQE